MRAESNVAAVVAMARGALMERHRCSAAEAAGQLADMAAAAGLPLPEMAAAVLGQEPPSAPAPAERAGTADPQVTVTAAERASDGAELVGVLAGQLRPRFGAAAVAVWLIEADGALGRRWRRLRLLAEHGGCHLVQRQARSGGHVRELPGGLGRRTAVPFHQRAPGHRDNGGYVRFGAQRGKLPPLALDDRGQPRQIIAVACHEHRLPL